METTLESGVRWELVRIRGQVTSADVGPLEEILQRFLVVGRYTVILDLAELTYIGSAGLSLFIRYATALRRWERGDLHLAALSPAVQSLLQVAGLVTEERSHFSIYPTVEAATEAAERATKQ